jgi:hypothetical protein
MSTILRDTLYPNVSTALTHKETLKKFNTDLDTYMAFNIDKYSTIGPIKRPIFSQTNIDNLISVVGLSGDQIKQALNKVKSVQGDWKNMNNPFNVAIVLSIHHFINTNDKDNIDKALSYMAVSMYPSLHFKYFKYEPNEAMMTYTINNMSNKFKIKQNSSVWESVVETMSKVIELHKPRLKVCDDRAMLLFINDVKTRLNSFLRKIANEFYMVEKEGKYMQLDRESFDEDNYHEADSNMYAIERITNNVVTTLVVNGPDMRLVEIAAKNCKVSVNELRNYTQSMITDKQRKDIRDVVEAVLFLYLFSETGKHGPKDVGTNEFLIYCMKVYKKSNTTDKNIIKLKSILDRWLSELGLLDNTNRVATINDFRRALYMFFVMTIIKLH